MNFEIGPVRARVEHVYAEIKRHKVFQLAFRRTDQLERAHVWFSITLNMTAAYIRFRGGRYPGYGCRLWVQVMGTMHILFNNSVIY